MSSSTKDEAIQAHVTKRCALFNDIRFKININLINNNKYANLKHKTNTQHTKQTTKQHYTSSP